MDRLINGLTLTHAGRMGVLVVLAAIAAWARVRGETIGFFSMAALSAIWLLWCSRRVSDRYQRIRWVERQFGSAN